MFFYLFEFFLLNIVDIIWMLVLLFKKKKVFVLLPGFVLGSSVYRFFFFFLCGHMSIACRLALLDSNIHTIVSNTIYRLLTNDASMISGLNCLRRYQRSLVSHEKEE